MYIASGELHTVLVSTNGQHIWTFGNNYYGNLGHGDKKDRYVPKEIKRMENEFPEDVKIVGVGCGFAHTVLLSEDGKIWTFGDNERCQLGLGDNKDRHVPTEIQRGELGLHKDVRIIGVSCGYDHTVLLSADGRIWTFGYNIVGQLGHGDIERRIVPTEIQRREDGIPEDIRIIGVSCGGHHTVLLSEDGKHIWTFGTNIDGQLGLGDRKYRNVPTEIQRREDGIPEDIRIIGVSCGRAHTVLLSDDGRIWTFGFNSFGQLGHGDKENRSVPTEIQRGEPGLPEDVRIIGVSCGDDHTVLLSDDGRIWTFGCNSSGMLGHGDNENRFVPIEIQRRENELLEDVKIIGVSCGRDHTVLLSDDGRIWTFGSNEFGQLGHGYKRNDTDRNVPTEIQDLSLRNLGSLTKSANKT
jgi:alpha-tubulin suppressor-like RCC1 family protein